ncbi:hypothetical protein NPIL_527521 [Nephila pilipes]|uniref:Uncharacterized protein n=1 Tax=Nephila pilipes TaxID=299642 RepID=A0A8X6TG45_NEPPI|nr:hypothetical protein NPIL_527521 [Nephila pilipes]
MMIIVIDIHKDWMLFSLTFSNEDESGVKLITGYLAPFTNIFGIHMMIQELLFCERTVSSMEVLKRIEYDLCDNSYKIVECLTVSRNNNEE